MFAWLPPVSVAGVGQDELEIERRRCGIDRRCWRIVVGGRRRRIVNGGWGRVIGGASIDIDTPVAVPFALVVVIAAAIPALMVAIVIGRRGFQRDGRGCCHQGYYEGQLAHPMAELTG